MNEKILNFAPYYDESLPLNIRMMGETICDDTIDVVRTKSELTALEYIDDGCGTLEIEGKCVYPQKNDVFFLKKGTCHHYYSSKENPWHKYWIIFDGPLAEMLIHEYLPQDIYHFPNCDCKEIVKNVIEIVKKYREDYKRMVDEITVEFIRFLVYIKHREDKKPDSLADRIRRRLDFYVEQEFSLDKICEELNYSKNHIIQVFEDSYGETPYQYYVEKKLEAAKIYLQNTTLPVGEIAERLSYCDQRYFSACFKSNTGMSPTEYRKKMQP
ncbi:MAG: AraC family transcriptional regulator [Candidatus Fimenecus sp.]